MIHDKIDNWKLYFKNRIFKEMFNQLATYTVETDNGIYRNHDSFYFKVMSYETQKEPKVIESHSKEVDIQIILSGIEHIKLYGLKDVEIIKGYCSDSDCQFYSNINNPISEIKLEPGYMAVFFPDDIHHPQFAVNKKNKKIKKIVIKINEKLFT